MSGVLVILGSNAVYRVDKPSFIIGRNQGDLILSDPQISRIACNIKYGKIFGGTISTIKHITFDKTDGVSLNGTYVKYPNQDKWYEVSIHGRILHLRSHRSSFRLGAITDIKNDMVDQMLINIGNTTMIWRNANCSYIYIHPIIAYYISPLSNTDTTMPCCNANVDHATKQFWEASKIILSTHGFHKYCPFCNKSEQIN